MISILPVDKLISESQSLFEDVIEDFSTVSEILERFEEWKRKYTDDYNDAYVGLCLPKLLSPLIKLSLISWNPLEVRSLSLCMILSLICYVVYYIFLYQSLCTLNHLHIFQCVSTYFILIWYSEHERSINIYDHEKASKFIFLFTEKKYY